MPADGSTEFPFIFDKTGKMVPVNRLNWHLKWTNNAGKATQAEWQVSVFPFTQDSKNRRTPPGLIGFGLVKSAPVMGNSRRLDINLAPVVTLASGSSVYTADAVNIKRLDEIVIKPPIRTPPIRQDRTIIKPDQTTIKPPVVNQRNTRTGGQTNLQRLKPQIRPSALAQLGKRTYYARLVPLDANRICDDRNRHLSESAGAN